METSARQPRSTSCKAENGHWTAFFSVVYCFCFVTPRDIWGLSSPTRDGTHSPCIERQSLNHWTAREILALDCLILKSFKYCFP